MPPHPLRRRALQAVLLLAGLAALGLINPGLQPNDLFDRHDLVLNLEMVRVDSSAKQVELEVRQVCKGRLSATRILVSAPGEQVEAAFQILARPGTMVVAYVGETARPGSDRVLFYPGGQGRWQIARRDPADPARWAWTKDIDPLEDERMLGTFNGDSGRLAEMMADHAAGRYWFPSVPQGLGGFGEDLVVARLGGPLRGVALHDLDGDGRPDLYACSPAGDRAFLQRGPQRFEDATAALGLEGLRSVSVNVADLDGDGDQDLLVGGRLLLAAREGGATRFAAAALLPADLDAGVKCAAFADLDGDGWPEVVAAMQAGGLRVFRNPGPGGGAFTEITAALGLDQPACGAGQAGFFAPGDWDGDGRCDLFFSVGSGLLLVQGADGRLAPRPHAIPFDFRSGGKAEGLAGAACFAPIWRPGADDLVAGGEELLTLMVRGGDGSPFDATPFGNEIHEGTAGMLAVIAEDLNADGEVDLYAASRQTYKNAIYLNRGHGSFMTPLAYQADFIPGQAHQRGAWGVAAGDADGDGAPELLLGGLDGALTLLPNRCLVGREADESSTVMERCLARTAVLSVRVHGPRGVVGAQVRLTDAQGRIVGRRMLGGNVATGCRGPDTADLALREPGPCTLSVRWSDGATASWPLRLEPGRRLAVDAKRP